MFRIRASSLPQIAACSASAYPPALNIESPGSEPSWLGDGVHESQKLYIVDGIEAQVGALAQKHRVDDGELGYLCYAARRAWQTISGAFPSPQCEEEFSWIDDESQIILTGHPDVFSIQGDSLTVADWKSGFLWSDCESQVRAYAWLIAQQFPVRTISGFHVNIRRDEIERWNWSYDELASWWTGMAERIKGGPETYSPGYEACRYCPRWRECPAGLDLAAEAIRLISDDETSVLSDATVMAYQRAKFVEKIAGDIVTSIRAMVAQAGGEFTATDGQALVLNRQKRDKVDAIKAFEPLLSNGISTADFLDACTLGKTKLLDHVRAAAPHRQKKQRADDVMGILRAAGAVSETFIEKLELRKAPAIAGVPKLIEQTV